MIAFGQRMWPAVQRAEAADAWRWFNYRDRHCGCSAFQVSLLPLGESAEQLVASRTANRRPEGVTGLLDAVLQDRRRWEAARS